MSERPKGSGLSARVLGKPALGHLRAVEVPLESWEELVACPVCGSGEHLQDVAVVRGSGPDPGAIMAVCSDCEHGFLRRRPTEDWFAGYYADDWDSGGQASPGKAIASTKIYEHLSSLVSPPGRVLDVGAGWGKELLGFREAGFDPFAVEASTHRAEFIAKLGIPVIGRTAGEAAEVAGTDGWFDVVFSRHVIEHVSDPVGVVADCAKALGGSGHLLVAVPNLWASPALQSAHFAPHQTLFSERSLRLVLARAGFHPVRSVANRELVQVARLAPDQPSEKLEAADEAVRRRQAFLGRVTEWMVDGLGGRGPGTRTLGWWKAKSEERNVDEVVLARGRVGAAKVGVARAQGHTRMPLPRRARALAPPEVRKPRTRIVTLRVTGPSKLPVEIRWPGNNTGPIWVK